ncbi:hypothetical protein [Schinkia azotoformans]|uniref:hypothetical protein n=1 Tax=Schinkia azotoformans TaxID=1454 RepID=UPI002DBB2BC5|nr:hypothetical protein [Schinkia azotoformans]MEC1780063.1 hypothetical protein [Schinkia azotoformans]MED4330858.1 hypothetical protein [Schinkia azotoformans]
MKIKLGDRPLFINEQEIKPASAEINVGYDYFLKDMLEARGITDYKKVSIRRK